MMIDSLEHLYTQATDGKDRVDLLIRLSEAYHDFDYPKAIALGYDALAIAKTIAYQKGVFFAYNTIGLSYNASGPIDSAYLYTKVALDLAIVLDDPYCLAIAKNNIGTYYLNQGNYPLSLQYFQEALVHDGETGEFIDPMSTYANIGIIHEELGDEKKAIDYYLKSAEAARLKGGEANLAYAQLDIGYVDCMLEKYDSALQHYQDALVIYKKLKHQNRVAETLYYIGEIYQYQKYFEKALAIQKEALQIYQQIHSVADIPSMYGVIANLYKEMERYEEAIAYYKEAIKLAQDGILTSLLPTMYKDLSMIYVDIHDYENAYHYNVMYEALKDTLFNEITHDRIAKLETTYELKVEQAENEKLINEQKHQALILGQRTLMAIGASLIALLVVIITIILYKSNRVKAKLNRDLEQKVEERTAALEAANQKLLQSNDELERFTYIASHDLKEPLRNITSFVNLMQRKLEKIADPDLQEYMGFVTRNTKQLYGLVEDILAHSRIGAQGQKTGKAIDLNVLLEEIKMGLRSMLEEKNAQIFSEELPVILGHKSELFMVLKNLVENGLKYNESPNPQVRINCKQEKDQVLFEVADNGIGIAPVYHDRIFEMFTRLNNRSIYLGSGIGLATCKKIIQKYQGEIWLESKVGKGSTFFFTLPLKKISENQVLEMK
ncbi:MAG: tetratricopeptide repeat protein [Saprospiraceae bacterium]